MYVADDKPGKWNRRTVAGVFRDSCSVCHKPKWATGAVFWCSSRPLRVGVGAARGGRRGVPGTFGMLAGVNERIVVGTDGACKGNPGPTGWAWYVDADRWRSGAMGRQTNNVGELEAILRALVDIPADIPVHVLTDSDYALKAVTVWWKAWKRKGWLLRDGKPVKNRERIELIVDMVGWRSAPTTFEWVKGHSGHPLNDPADRLAVRAREQSPREVAVYGPGWGVAR